MLGQAQREGKYDELIRVYPDSPNQAVVGKLKDRGWFAAGSGFIRSSHRESPPAGYRVYVSPFWHVFRKIRPEALCVPTDPALRAVNSEKYSELLRKLESPEDY